MAPELLEALIECHAALSDVTTKDAELYCSLSAVVVRGLELKTIGDDDGDNRQGNLELAVDVCRKGIKHGTVMQAKALHAALARLQRERGIKEPLPEDERAKVFAILELLELSSDVVPVEEKRDLLPLAVEALGQWEENNTDRVVALPEDPLSNPDATAEAVEAAKDCAEGHAELWARLGHVALDLEALGTAQGCVRRAVEPLPSSVSNTATIGEKCWRWFSTAECLWGQIVSAFIVADKQEKTTQDELRQRALGHLCLAAKWGTKARIPALVTSAARHFWNVAIPFTVSAVTRRMLYTSIRIVLDELARLGTQPHHTAGEDGEFRVVLYCQLFQCLADVEDWAGGLAAVDDAFKHVPQGLHKSLWEARVVFSSKLGKDVAAGLHKMKEGDASLQAKAWVTLARSSSIAGDQLRAYTAAIDALSGSFERVDYLIEFGEWLFVNNFARQDASDVLLAAADLLIGVEYPATSGDDDDEPEPNDGHDGSIALSRAGSRRTSRTQRSQTGVNQPRAGSASSRAGTQNSRGNNRARRGAPSVTSSRGGRSSALKSSHRRASGAHSSASEGGGGAGLPSGFPDHLEISHLLTLCRVYVMLAHISCDQLTRADYSLLAHDCILRTWQMSVRAANLAEAAVQRSQFTPDDERGNMSLGELLKTIPVNQLHTLPQSAHGWVSFTPSEALRSRFRESGVTPDTKGCTLCAPHVPNPPRLLHYLLELVELLVSHGFDLHALPVLTLIGFIASDVVSPELPSLVSFVRLKTVRLLDWLNEPLVARQTMDALAPYAISEETRKRLTYEVLQLEQQQQKIAPLNESSVDQSTTDSDESLTQCSESGLLSMVDIQPMKRKSILKVEVREIWVMQAYELSLLGEYAAAKTLLKEAERHNVAFKDQDNQAAAGLVRARIDILEGNVQAALRNTLRSLRIFREQKGDLKLWVSGVETLADCLRLQGRRREARAALSGAVAVFSECARAGGANEDLDAIRASALVETELAEEFQFEALDTFARGNLSGLATSESNGWSEAWSLACEHFKHAANELERCGAHPTLIHVLLRHGKAALRVYEKSGRQRENISILESAVSACQKAKSTAEYLLARSCPPDKPETVLLPIERMLGEVLLVAGNVALRLVEWSSDEGCVSTLAPINGERLDQLNEVERWLQETAPPRERTESDKLVSPQAKALLYFSSAAHLLQPVVELHVLAMIGMGRGLRCAAGLGDDNAALQLCASDVHAMPGVTSEGTDIMSVNPAPSAILASAGTPLSQSIYILEAALNTALTSGKFEAAEVASLELVDSVGPGDMRKAVEYLCLYQSCRARKWLSEIYAAASPSTSKQGLFLNSRAHLKGKLLHPQCTTPHGAAVADFLDTVSVACRRLDCRTPSVAKIVEGLPAESVCLTLSLSPDSRIIYAAVVGNRVYDGADAEGKPDDTNSFNANIDSIPRRYALARRTLSISERSALRELVEGFSAYRKQIATFLLRYQDEMGEAGDWHSTGDACSAEGALDDRLEVEICSMISRLEKLVGPVLADPRVKSLLKAQPHSTYGSTTCEEKTNSLQTQPHLLLIPDIKLARLPLEALNALSHFTAVSRDFSLHLQHHRQAAVGGNGATCSGLSYVCDPRYDDCDSGKSLHRNATTVFRGLISKHGSPSWTGIEGKDGIPGVGCWQRLLADCGNGILLYYGLGRLLAHIQPALISGLDLSSCWAALLLDRTANDASYRRQSKIDNQCSAAHLALQQPLECAALFSLLGVNTMALNQWSNSPTANELLADTILGALKQDSPLAEAVRTLPKSKQRLRELKARVKWNCIHYGLNLKCTL